MSSGIVVSLKSKIPKMSSRVVVVNVLEDVKVSPPEAVVKIVVVSAPAGKMGPIIGLTLAFDSRPPLPSTWTVLLRMTLRSSRRDPFEVVTASGGHFVKRERESAKDRKIDHG